MRKNANCIVIKKLFVAHLDNIIAINAMAIIAIAIPIYKGIFVM
ncbi:MAG: hypothetical protein RR938_05425 [Muribaculaceae bacterium]